MTYSPKKSGEIFQHEGGDIGMTQSYTRKEKKRFAGGGGGGCVRVT